MLEMRRIYIIIVLLLYGICLRSQTTPKRSLNDGDFKVQQEDEKSKIFFRENLGQISDQNYKPREDILYSGNSGGISYFLKQGGLHYQLYQIDNWKDEYVPSKNHGKEKKKVPGNVSYHRLDISWPGSNPNPKIEAANTINGYDNY